MTKIILFSPVSLKDKFQSGITIRLDGIGNWFKNNGLKVAKTDKINRDSVKKGDFFYVMISTKTESISYQVIQLLPPNKPLIVDLYTPLLLEKRTSFVYWNPLHWLHNRKSRQVIKNILNRGSHFLVANHRQKKYWVKTSSDLGMRIKKNNISVIPTGSSMLSVVKSQLSKASPERSRRVILWFGGIYPWMDPLPLIKAFSKIASEYPKWKLRILGGFHPKTGYQKLYQKVIRHARQEIPSNQLEIIPWQLSDNLGQYLADVSFAVHLIRKTKEDYYAHRVRLLTLLEAGIPIMTNGDDLISKFLVKEKTGDKINLNFKSIENRLKFLINSQHKVTQFSKNAPQIEKTYIKNESNILKLKQILY